MGYPRRRRKRAVYAPPVPKTPEEAAAQQAAAEAAEAEKKAKEDARKLRIATAPDREAVVQFGEVITLPKELRIPAAVSTVEKIWYVKLSPEQLPEFARRPFIADWPMNAVCGELRASIAQGTWQTDHWQDRNALGGAKNQAEIDEVYKSGWAEGAEKARKLMNQLGEVPEAQSTRRRREVGTDGDDVVVEAWIEKDYDHLFERRRKVVAQGHKIIQIGIGWGGNADKTGDQLFWGGAAALVLTEQLEAAGYGVETHAYSLIATGWGGDPNVGVVMDIVVKPSDQPIAVDSFAAVMAHAGSFRSYGLIGQGHCPWYLGNGCGHAENFDRAASALAEAGIIPEVEILLPNVYSLDTAVRAIRQGLEDVKYSNIEREENEAQW